MELNNTDNLAENIDAKSEFNGGMLANYFIRLATLIVSLITLGLAYPAMVCWKLKWEASHTYLNGQQLTFDGKAMQLMGKYVLWMFLSIITFGLYYIFSAKLKLTEWQTKHTHFANYNYDEDKNESKFNGKWYQLFAVNFVCRFVTIITLFIGYYWAHCYKERWYCKHKTIDGCELTFDGTGMQYFGKRIIWTLLTIVTLGIYSFWLQIKSVKWTISHTNLVEIPNKVSSIKMNSTKSVRNGVMLIIKDDNRNELIKIIDEKSGIKTEMFYECKSLREVIIPNGITVIGDRAFGFCSSMTKVYIPLSVTKIGDMAFDGCGKVKIYCLADSKPEGWSSTWNHCDYPVVWGYKGD